MHTTKHIIGVSATLLALISTEPSIAGSRLTTLYSFCVKGGCDDGTHPSSRLLYAGGALYGLTEGGGGPGDGTLFRLTPQGAGWQHDVLHNFCAAARCKDGAVPIGALVIDTAGNLYGTTSQQGAHSAGGVFELSPTGEKWAFKSLYDFCAKGDCFDGRYSYGGLTYVGAASGAPYDGAAALYGTTNFGGANDKGAVYQLTRKGKKWSEKVLYNFCARSNCADGAFPVSALIADAAGNLYGTTLQGGAHSGGTVFALSRNEKGKWAEAVLYNFCAKQGCADGDLPQAELVMDASGALYGTTSEGGAADEGALFKLVKDGDKWSESVLHSFCAKKNCTDGAKPQSGLLLDAAGNLLGTTYSGGAHDRGTVFRFSTSEKVLHDFCTKSDCADGSRPSASLTLDPDGNVYGTTYYGGANDDGAVFKLVP